MFQFECHNIRIEFFYWQLTLKVKYEALKKLEKGRPNKDVANQSCILGGTLATWNKNKRKIFEDFQNSSLKRKE